VGALGVVVMINPTPEEKCCCGKEIGLVCEYHKKVNEYLKSSPSPEARVDWEKKLLTDFCNWLEDAGYLDDDWWREEPKAVDRYLFERKKFIKTAAFEKGRRSNG